MTQLNRIVDFRLPTGILGGTLAADHETLVAGCLDGVYLANVRSKSVERIGLHSSYVSSATFFRNDAKILSAGYDGTLQWFDVESKSRIREVQLHDFWSWDLAVSSDGRRAASVTGQYLAGGYKYEPQAESEPSLKIVDTESGDILHSLPHVPSVQAVAFSPDNRFVAAGNLMGEVRIWDVDSGEQVGGLTTEDFTSWGIIKTHSYIGGIFAIAFTPDSSELLLAGMGKMRDPMAGNGRQLWQKWKWRGDAVRTAEINHKEAGEGLMETLAVHPGGKLFAMGGRLRGGDWNVALFDLESGSRITKLKTGCRVTEASFSSDGKLLTLVGCQGQPKKKGPEYKPSEFGRVEIYEVG